MYQVKSLSLTAIFVCVLSILLSAQGPPPRGSHSHPPGPPGEPQREGGRGPGPGRGRGGAPPNFIAAEMFSDGKIIKGQPYAAIATTEKIQVLGDGTKISHKTTVEISRDSEGRTRRETKDAGLGMMPFSDQALHLIFINDPVAKTSYVLDPTQQTAQKNSRPPGPPPPQIKLREAEGAKTESLGTQMIEGVEAQGTRTTITIPVGEIGNDRPLEIVSERWEAPALQVVVLSKHKDPRNGETIYRLTNINRTEPAHTLFEVPTNYTVTEGKGFGLRPEKNPPPPQGQWRENKPRRPFEEDE